MYVFFVCMKMRVYVRGCLIFNAQYTGVLAVCCVVGIKSNVRS